MSEYMGFSNDHMWWWNGTGWMPTHPPDGRSATWTGSAWMARGGWLHWGWVLGIALALGFMEFVWAIVGFFFVIIPDVNARWEARGRVGYEDLSDSPLTVPILLTLLLVPILVTILAAASFRSRWWLGVLVLGGWPAIAVALLALTTPGTGVLSFEAEIGAVLAALVAIGWLVHLVVFRRWRLAPDGQRWVRGGSSFSTLSPDGRWRWDGRTWLAVEPPGGAIGG